MSLSPRRKNPLPEVGEVVLVERFPKFSSCYHARQIFPHGFLSL
jgi:hypothetical protein